MPAMPILPYRGPYLSLTYPLPSL